MEHKKVSDKGVLDHVCLSDTLFMLLAVFVSQLISLIFMINSRKM